MTFTNQKQARPASGTRVQNSASVVGHAFVFLPPAAVVWCFAISSFIMAPLVVKQAEAALEDAAWAAGRILSTGLALSHVFDGEARHDRIVADDTVDALPPRPRAADHHRPAARYQSAAFDAEARRHAACGQAEAQTTSRRAPARRFVAPARPASRYADAGAGPAS